MHDVLTTFGWVLFTGIAVWSVPALLWFLLRELRPVASQSDRAPAESDSSGDDFVSIIVPACNEERGIDAALRSLLKTSGIRFRIVAVNDRSTDATGRLMDLVARDDVRCSVIHIHELPEGWLGKNHAMHVAAEQAVLAAKDQPHHLLLFTDGDVVFEPNAVQSAVAHLRKRDLQHLCLLPRMLPGGLVENSVVAFFGLTVAIGQQVHLMPTRWPFSYAGIGAFNLVTQPMYQTIGGHQRIAMDVLDDIKLGKLVRQHKGKQDLLAAPKLLSLRWYDNLWAVITGLEKNGFAALSYSGFRLAAVTLLFLTTMIAPYVLAAFSVWPMSSGYWASGYWASGYWATGYWATVLLWHTMFAAVTWKFCTGSSSSPVKTVAKTVVISLLFPVAAVLMAFAFHRSAWKTWRQGGVQWRTTFYDLKTLKDNIYQ